MTTPRLALPELVESHHAKEQTHNAALGRLDALVGPAVESLAETDPPGSPAEGDLYVPAATATGAWAGHEDEIAQYLNAAWAFYVPWDGLMVWSVADQAGYRWNDSGGAWVLAAGQGDLKADGSVAMTGALQMAGNEVQQPALRDAREVQVTNATATGAVSLDLAAGNAFSLTLTGNVTLSFANEPGAGVALGVSVACTQDATGGRTVTWPAGVVWADGTPPTLSTAGTAKDLFALVRLGGTWYGLTAGLAFA
jgi:hypothetical protein